MPHSRASRLRCATTLLLALPALIAAAASLPPAAPAAHDRWYAIELFGRHVGHAHSASGPVAEGGWRSRLDSRTELARGVATADAAAVAGAAVETLVATAQLDWLEDAGGRTVRVTSVVDQGGGPVRTVGEWRGERFEVTVATAHGERRSILPWDARTRSPRDADAAVAALVARAAAGERVGELAFRTFDPEAGSGLLEVRVRVIGPTAEGIAVEQMITGLDVAVREVWSPDGVLLRQEVGPVAMRLVSREEALAPIARDLAGFRTLSVALSGRAAAAPGSATARRLASYRLVPRPGATPPPLGAIFSADARQRIERDAAGEERLRVAVQPPPAAAAPTVPSPDPDALAPSSLIESDDPQIRELARRVTGADRAGQPRPPEAVARWRAARALELWVHRNLRYRGSGIGLASARQTLASRDGDCTEHATLLAALLRAVAIPARLVVGLAKPPGGAGGEAIGGGGADARLYPHAWVEAWVGGAWHPLDAALWAPEVDATHLAMAATAAADEGALLALAAPLLRGLGSFDLERVE